MYGRLKETVDDDNDDDDDDDDNYIVYLFLVITYFDMYLSITIFMFNVLKYITKCDVSHL